MQAGRCKKSYTNGAGMGNGGSVIDNGVYSFRYFSCSPVSYLIFANGSTQKFGAVRYGSRRSAGFLP